ncbi:hypothetical protein [Methylobacterium sp. Leaf111]|uniref:hypothetical protein n=1 Tax=Methylobacterium sp. Leaf111 TaxID=1736257 RepID=UPI000B07E85C|nr:hypothetical protein [Methylobacterium sp. Leaf111]
MRTITRSLLGAPFLLATNAYASQGPGARLGTASPDLQAFTLTIVLFQVVAILVFATARIIGFWEGPSQDYDRACRKRECAFVHGSLAIPDQLAASALEPAHDPVCHRRQAEAALQG